MSPALGRSTRACRALLALVAITLAVPGFARATPSWTAPAVLSTGGENNRNPELGVDASGNATAIWNRHNGSRYVIQTADHPAGGPWSTPTTLTATTQDNTLPQLAVDAAGNATATWLRTDVNPIRLMASTRPVGGQWGEPIELARSDLFGGDVALAADRNGTVVAAWGRMTSVSPAAWSIETAARSANGAWQSVKTVTTSTGFLGDPALGFAESGIATLLWRQSSGGSIRAFASVLAAPTGTWAAPSAVSAAGRGVGQTRLAVDSAGRATAVWASTADGSPGGPYRVEASSRATSGIWQTPVTLASDHEFNQGVAVAAAPSGVLTAAWVERNGASARVGVSTHYEWGWSSGETLATGDGGMSAPLVAFDPSSNTTVAWSQSEASAERVQARRRPAGGYFGLVADLSASSSAASPAALVPTSEGDMAVAWVRNDGTWDQIEVAAFDQAGPQLLDVSVPATSISRSGTNLRARTVDTWSVASAPTWDVGDGSKLTGTSVLAAYPNPGSYTVTLGATDALGNSSTTTRPITVSSIAAPPGPEPTPTPDLLASGRSLTITTLIGRTTRAKRCPRSKEVRFRVVRPAGAAITKRTVTVSRGAVVNTCTVRASLRLRRTLTPGSTVRVRVESSRTVRVSLSTTAG